MLCNVGTTDSRYYYISMTLTLKSNPVSRTQHTGLGRGAEGRAGVHRSDFPPLGT